MNIPAQTHPLPWISAYSGEADHQFRFDGDHYSDGKPITFRQFSEW